MMSRSDSSNSSILCEKCKPPKPCLASRPARHGAALAEDCGDYMLVGLYSGRKTGNDIRQLLRHGPKTRGPSLARCGALPRPVSMRVCCEPKDTKLLFLHGQSCSKPFYN